jgi:hypothetical protein
MNHGGWEAEIPEKGLGPRSVVCSYKFRLKIFCHLPLGGMSTLIFPRPKPPPGDYLTVVAFVFWQLSIWEEN